MLVLRNQNNFPTLFNDRSKVTTSPRLSSWIDDVFENALQWTTRTGNGTGAFLPELNVYETDKEFEVTVSLPGMRREDIEVSYEKGLLTISGERKPVKQDDGRRYHRIESRFGRFSRSLPLPADMLDDENISARYDNGVLYVTVPKTKDKAGRKIDIQ